MMWELALSIFLVTMAILMVVLTFVLVAIWLKEIR
jgi:hypothetical protein